MKEVAIALLGCGTVGKGVVDLLTMNGALVKTASAKSETSFTLKPGVYIVNAKSEKGVKSQKVMIK